MFISCTTENRKVPSANNLVSDDMPSDKSLIQIKKSSGLRIDPCGTPALTLVQEAD